MPQLRRPSTSALGAFVAAGLAATAAYAQPAPAPAADPSANAPAIAPSAPTPVAAPSALTPTTAPTPAQLRIALAQAREKVEAALDDTNARLNLASLLLQVGEYRESAVQLAEVARMVPDHPELEARLQATLRQWHAADPPRPGQASAYADYCKAAKSPVGGARLLKFSKMALGACESLAAEEAAELAKIPAAATATASAKSAVPPKPGAVTQDSLLRIWVITALGAAIFIGGGTWLTRKHRGKDAPRKPSDPA